MQTMLRSITSALLFVAAWTVITISVAAQTPEPPANAAAAAEDPAKFWLDQGYRELGRSHSEQALNAFQTVLAMEPRSRQARFGMGTAYIQLERYKEALATLEPLAREFPDDYTLKNNIAWLYATAKDHTVRSGRKAVAYAQDALIIAPRDYHVWNTLSEAHYVSGDYEKAQRAAEEAARLAKDFDVPPEEIATYQLQVDKCRKAAEAMSLLE